MWAPVRGPGTRPGRSPRGPPPPLQPPRPSPGRSQLHLFRDLPSRLGVPRGRPPHRSQGISGLGREAARAGPGLAPDWASRASPAAPTPPRPQAGPWRPHRSERLGRDASGSAASLRAFSSGEDTGVGAFAPKVVGRATAPTTYNRAQRPLARTEKPLSPSHPHLKTNNNKMCPSVQLCGPGGRVGGRAGGDWAEGAAWGAKGRGGRASPH